MTERIEQLQGRLGIHSEPGAGTTIRIFLPLGGSPAAVPPEESELESSVGCAD